MNLGNHKVNWRHLKNRGVSICTVTSKEGHFIGQGIATCSNKDNFNTEIGRKTTLSRAITGKLNKEQRAAIWDGFRNMTQQPKWE